MTNERRCRIRTGTFESRNHTE